MKKSLVSGVALALALSAGSAFAADLPSRKAPPYVPPPPPMWTGFYVGLNAGYTFANSNNMVVNSGVLAATAVAPGAAANAAAAAAAAAGVTGFLPAGNNSGFLGGGQIGYNWQFASNFVAGVEADIQGVAAGGGSGSAFTTAVPTAAPAPVGVWVSSTTASKRLDYLGTVRGRIGYLITPTLLVYGTGGLAYGGVSTSLNISQLPTGAALAAAYAPMFGASAFSDTRVGWTAGGGLEWMFMPNWSAKVEYLYYDLGNVAINSVPLVAVAPAGVAFANSAWTTTRFDGHIVRAGVNYHFNWGAAPVVAKY
jgi:outer membrane immunogenic protein